MIKQENTKFTKIVNEVFKLTNFLALEKIQNYLEEVDKKILDEVSRLEYVVNSKRERYLWTPFGDIKFSRTEFKNKRTGKTVYLADKELGLVPYWYVQPVFFEMLISNISEIKSYKSLSKMFGDRFSTIQITRMIKRFNFYLKPKKLQDGVDKIFVNLDGMWLHQHKSKKKEFKFAVLYTGSTEDKRPKLINKTIIPFKPGISSLKIAEKLEQFIFEVYGEVKEIIIVGDGAHWISEVSKNTIIKTTRSIDNFHYKFWFNKLMGVNRRSKNRVDWHYWLSIKNQKEFKEKLLHQFIDWETGEIIMSKQQKELFNKLVKWFNKWKLTNKNKWINSIEGIQSHVLSSTFKFKRSFGNKTIFKILMINCANYNNWNLTVKKENSISLNQMYNDDVINDISWSNDDNTSNVPHLKNGISSGIAIVLNKIAH